MTDAFFTKMNSRTLAANTDHDAEILSSIKTGDTARVTIKKVRNYEFLSKYFVLLDYVYDLWEPENAVGEKNKD